MTLLKLLKEFAAVLHLTVYNSTKSGTLNLGQLVSECLRESNLHVYTFQFHIYHFTFISVLPLNFGTCMYIIGVGTKNDFFYA